MTTTELLKALDEAGLFLWADGETLLVIGVAKPGTDPALVDAIQAHRSALLRELRAGPICVACRKPITGELVAALNGKPAHDLCGRTVFRRAWLDRCPGREAAHG